MLKMKVSDDHLCVIAYYMCDHLCMTTYSMALSGYFLTNLRGPFSCWGWNVCPPCLYLFQWLHRSCSSACLSFSADRADSRLGLQRKLSCQSCGKRAAAARLPAYHSPLTGLVAGKVCIESLVVNHVSKERELLVCRLIIRLWPGW